MVHSSQESIEYENKLAASEYEKFNPKKMAIEAVIKHQIEYRHSISRYLLEYPTVCFIVIIKSIIMVYPSKVNIMH